MVEVIEARWVLPIEPWQVLEHAGVAVGDGRIVAVAPQSQLRKSYPDAPRIVLADHVLMPGLINAHTHAAMTLLRGYADDVALMTWLRERIWPTESRWVDPQFVTDGTRLAAAEMVAGGVTCFSDMYFFPASAITAASDAGIRIMAGQVVVEADTPYARGAADHLRKAVSVIEQHRGLPEVHLCLAPHAPYTVSDATFGRLQALAEHLDVPVHTHLHETADEVAQGVAEHGVRPLARLDRLGIVGPRLIGAHAVHLTDDEIALLAEREAALVHCPVSNLKLASGVARFADWLGSGLRVGLGTDGVASNNRLDLLGDMRIAALLAKGSTGDAAAVPAAQALHTATLGAAGALGLSGLIGSLTVGKAADLVAVDMSRSELAPVYDVVSHLVHCAERQDVTDVWVAGRRLKEAGALTREDPAELRALADSWRSRIG